MGRMDNTRDKIGNGSLGLKGRRTSQTNASGSGAPRLLKSNLRFHSQQINSPAVFTEFFSRLNTQWVALGAQRGNHPRQALQSYDEATSGKLLPMPCVRAGSFNLRSTYISSIEIFSEAVFGSAAFYRAVSTGLIFWCSSTGYISPMTSTQSYSHLHLVSDFTGETVITVARAAAAQYAQGFGGCCARFVSVAQFQQRSLLRSSLVICCAALALDRAAFALFRSRGAPT